mmetsp:Transcript_3097/g.8539  ORF Transcript_3097/g.8539 Transcript_3097/m.8539 type:complete len:83 (-) Transcript_3097:607-855(-)
MEKKIHTGTEKKQNAPFVPAASFEEPVSEVTHVFHHQDGGHHNCNIYNNNNNNNQVLSSVGDATTIATVTILLRLRKKLSKR